MILTEEKSRDALMRRCSRVGSVADVEAEGERLSAQGLGLALQVD